MAQQEKQIREQKICPNFWSNSSSTVSQLECNFVCGWGSLVLMLHVWRSRVQLLSLVLWAPMWAVKFDPSAYFVCYILSWMGEFQFKMVDIWVGWQCGSLMHYLSVQAANVPITSLLRTVSSTSQLTQELSNYGAAHLLWSSNSWNRYAYL
jgi:hypothetical protein